MPAIAFPKYNEPGPAHKLHTLAERLTRVRARVRAAELAGGRAPGSVRLLAVSKTQPAAAVRTLAGLGQTAFGESYVQEALDKMTELAGLALEWHYIGRIQRNKTADIAAHFDWVHGLDREALAERLHAQRPAARAPLNVCIQVNIDAAPTKAGVAPAALPALAHRIAALPRLRLRGLMTIPQPAAEPAAQRRPFRDLRLAYELLIKEGFALDTLSMGMSADMEAAIAEGATMVRIGTDLFGPRGV